MLCMLLITICVLSSNFPSCVPKKSTHDLRDFTGRADKLKMQHLAKGLVIEAKLYHRQVMQIREAHSSYLAYEVGLVIGKIREKYKRMMEAYHEAINRRRGRFTILPSPITAEGYKAIHYLDYMETIRALEMDIDKHVHVLETIPPKLLNDVYRPDKLHHDLSAANMSDFPHNGSLNDLPSGVAKLMLRTEDKPLSPGSTKHPLSADDVKQAFRDQYYSKTRDDNWTLDDYYGFPG